MQPIVLAPHAVPNRHPSGLHDWSNANLLCLNAYTSKYEFAPGSIRTVKLYTRDAAGNPKPLGTAPVERDGSFFVQVPTEQPLQIELLDAAGRTLKRESGFFWMRRGEQRGCVGCHAGPETAPENAVPMTLLKSTTPADYDRRTPHKMLQEDTSLMSRIFILLLLSSSLLAQAPQNHRSQPNPVRRCHREIRNPVHPQFWLPEVRFAS